MGTGIRGGGGEFGSTGSPPLAPCDARECPLLNTGCLRAAGEAGKECHPAQAPLDWHSPVNGAVGNRAPDQFKALAVLSSDAISSVAYATEAILINLVAGGSAHLGLTLPISLFMCFGARAVSCRQRV